jgi:hypothetical protein
MLSPNATKRVTLNFGGTVSVTLKAHDAVCVAESAAAQLTPVVPMLNTAPLAGVHVTCVGGVPPVAVADGYWTGIDWPVVDCVD